eukprot:747081-Hanusia_phi.AAC.3
MKNSRGPVAREGCQLFAVIAKAELESSLAPRERKEASLLPKHRPSHTGVCMPNMALHAIISASDEESRDQNE